MTCLRTVEMLLHGSVQRAYGGVGAGVQQVGVGLSAAGSG